MSERCTEKLNNSIYKMALKAVEIFMIRKSFRPNSSEAIRHEAEVMINEKHYQGYRLINVDFDVADNAGYIYAFITMKRPNSY